ncbi:MAG: endonuclease V [Aeropyrum sp.]|nr:endonuclease V [Aeropyrum sp.]
MNSCACNARFSAGRAIEAQRILSRRLSLKWPGGEARRALGLDASYARVEGVDVGVGAAVLMDSSTLETLGCSLHIAPVCVPYIPGLLAFRELQVMAPAASALAPHADVILVDGHGIAHPRGFGIASHVGVVLGKPSVGVAKRRLVGEIAVLGGEKVVVSRGAPVAVVIDRPGGPIYVSPGHMIDLKTAVYVVKPLLKHRLPEPTRLADLLGRIARNGLKRQATLGKEWIEGCVVRASGCARSLALRLEGLGFSVEVW